MSPRTRNRLAATVAAVALGLAACGEAEPIVAPPATDAATEVAPTETTAAPAAETVINATAGQTELGEILVGDDAMTLYGFLNDVDGQSACNGTCAEAWPPLIVGPNWDVAPGLDAGIFNTVERNDGSLQLVAGKWPLYYYGGDAIPGDVNGQGNGEVWFVVGTDGVLIKDAAEGAGAEEAAADVIVATGSTDLGDVLVDAEGLSLYGFLNDVDGEPTCFDACADAWPPVFVPSADLPEGLDPEVFSVVEFEDKFQLKAGIWPLYRFAGDGAPGDINGQESGDVWFLAKPDGGLIKPGAAEAAPAEDHEESDSDY